MSEVKFAISEAAKQLHVEAHVLRYWEEELGLHIGRTEMGHRYYTEDDIQLFRCIKKLKNEGVLLRELKSLIPELTMIRHRKAELNASDSSAELPKIAPAATPKVTHSDAPEETAGEAAPQEMPTTDATQTATEMPTTGAPQTAAQMPTTGAPQTTTDPVPDSAPVETPQEIPQEMPGTISEPVPGTSPETASTGAMYNIPDDGQALPPETTPAAASITVPTTASDAASTTAPVTAPTTAPNAASAEVIEVTRLEQVRSLFGEVINEAITSNNRTLERNISRRVTSNVCREIDLLFQVQEQQGEEYYHKLDNLIRQQQAYRRESAEITPLGALKKLFT